MRGKRGPDERMPVDRREEEGGCGGGTVDAKEAEEEGGGNSVQPARYRIPSTEMPTLYRERHQLIKKVLYTLFESSPVSERQQGSCGSPQKTPKTFYKTSLTS